MLLLAGALIVMRFRNLHRTYSAFAGYLVASLVFEAAGFWLRFFYSGPRVGGIVRVYWSMFWAEEIVKGVICFLVLANLYFQLFRDYEGLRRFAKALFQWVAATLFLVSVVIAVTTHANTHWLSRLVLVLDITATIFIVGFLIFLFALSGYFTLGWRHYAIGIAMGFALQAPLYLLTQFMQMEFGEGIIPTVTIVLRVAYAAALILWVGYLLLPQPRTRTVAALPHHSLMQWNQALLRYMQ